MLHQTPGGRRLISSNLKRTVLRALVEIRFRDGEVLHATNQPQRRSGAIYLAGYGVECALKARICEDCAIDYLPKEFQHHDLRALAEATAVWPRIQEGFWLQRLTFLQSEWHVTMRYAAPSYAPRRVREFIEKGRDFVAWLFAS